MTESKLHPLLRVESVELPPNQSRKEGDRVHYRGFALVTLADPMDARWLLDQWPWNIHSVQNNLAKDTEVEIEAQKFGFRTLPKTRWKDLQAEYLRYQRRLVQQLEQYSFRETSVESESASPRQPLDSIDLDISATHTSPRYPLDCLVFVKNLHPETNKTTLKKLFSTALESQVTQDSAFDYVDYTKGLDTVGLFTRIYLEHSGTDILTSVTFAAHLHFMLPQ